MLRACLLTLSLICAASAQERTPWTTSRIHGTPEPPKPYTTEPVLSAIELKNVLEITALPGHVLLLQNDGQIWSTAATLDSPEKHLVLDLKTKHAKLDHLYGIAFHPQWKTNRQVFLTYTTGAGLDDGSKLSRFTLSSLDPLIIDPASEEVLLTWLSGGHNGAHLQFGPDGKLYLSTGDAEVPAPPDPRNTGQDNSDLLSAILRLDIDARSPGLPYAIPADNPFLGKPNVRPEIYAFGFRNPWKIAFDPAGGLWCGDVGWELWEMIHFVQRGGNHGWSAMEATQPIKPETLSPLAPITPPLVAHPHTEAASITGGYVYRGSRLPDLRGAYLYADYETGKIWALWLDPAQPDSKVSPRIRRHEEIADTPHKIVTFGLLPDGDLIYAHYGTPATFHRLIPNPKATQPSNFPRQLSQTGLFQNTATHTPAPGVYPFDIAEPMWQDGAIAQRLVALPADTQITTVKKKPVWPPGSVLARTVSLEQTRLETQLLHFDGEAWAGYTYQWNDTGTDATLVPPNGSERALPDSRAHTLHSRSDCLRCHTPWAGHTLAFQPQQLTQIAGQSASDAATALHLTDADFFTASTARLVTRDDPSATPESRARAWLHTNCAHCHRQHGGGSVALKVNIDLPLAETALLNEKPLRGTLGIPDTDARLIAPGHPELSVLLPRIARTGPGHMPIIGSQLPDPHALTTLWTWVQSLAPPSSPSPSSSLSPDLPASIPIPQALQLLHALESNSLDRQALQPQLTRFARSPNTDLATLFERFLPASERQPRLGPNPDPQKILALTGDPAAGAALLSPTGALANCRTCHFIEGTGRDFGPDLTQVGARLTPDQLLESLLQPAKTLTPGFIAHSVQTTDGQTHLGFIVQQTQADVTLKLPTAQSLTLPRQQIQTLIALPTSLMPEGQLQHLTPQQAADILSYLSRLK